MRRFFFDSKYWDYTIWAGCSIVSALIWGTMGRNSMEPVLARYSLSDAMLVILTYALIGTFICAGMPGLALAMMPRWPSYESLLRDWEAYHPEEAAELRRDYREGKFAVLYDESHEWLESLDQPE